MIPQKLRMVDVLPNTKRASITEKSVVAEVFKVCGSYLARHKHVPRQAILYTLERCHVKNPAASCTIRSDRLFGDDAKN